MASDGLARRWRALLAAAALALGGCYDGDPADFREAVVAGRDKVTGLVVTAPATIIEVGSGMQLNASAATAPGPVIDVAGDVTWRSSAPGVLAVDDGGRVTALSDGTATITAELAVYSASVSVTASSAALQGIAVSGAVAVDECRDAAYAASGHYDDGSDRDITGLVTWAVDDAAIARMSNLAGERNRLLAKNAGLVAVTASRNGVESAPFSVNVLDTLDVLSLTPAAPPEMAVGDSRTFTATGTWGADSAVVSRNAVWSVVNDDSTLDRIASAGNGDNDAGKVTAESGGTGTLSVSCGGLTASVPITVTYLQSLAITNSTPITMAPDSSLLLALEGTYSDGSVKSLNEQATWSATLNVGSIVSVSNSAGTRGLVTSTGTGSSVVSATVDGKSVSVTVTVGN